MKHDQDVCACKAEYPILLHKDPMRDNYSTNDKGKCWHVKANDWTTTSSTRVKESMIIKLDSRFNILHSFLDKQT